MDDYLARIYLNQALQECEHCFHSIDFMERILRKEIQGDFFHYALDMIHHAAAVSRIFWPTPGRNKLSTERSKLRGQALRTMLNLENQHTVEDKSLRNHFEHFDERLDDWAENSKFKNIVHKLIGPRERAISGACIADTDIIHHFDPATNIFAFRGEKYDLSKLALGLIDIHDRINTKLQEINSRNISDRRNKSSK